jgi:hypothetical protein
LRQRNLKARGFKYRKSGKAEARNVEVHNNNIVRSNKLGKVLIISFSNQNK